MFVYAFVYSRYLEAQSCLKFYFTNIDVNSMLKLATVRTEPVLRSPSCPTSSSILKTPFQNTYDMHAVLIGKQKFL